MISDTAVVRIVNSRRNNEVRLDACKEGGGSPLQRIMNGTSAILRRGEIEKPITILALAPGDCGSEQSFNFLDVALIQQGCSDLGIESYTALRSTSIRANFRSASSDPVRTSLLGSRVNALEGTM